MANKDHAPGYPRPCVCGAMMHSHKSEKHHVCPGPLKQRLNGDMVPPTKKA